MREAALADAERADSEIASGRYRGALHGIPISVKDLVDVAGTPTTAGSRVPADTATADAPVVRRLREAGAIIIGKTNLHEFAFGTTSDETAFGAVRNPLDPSRSPGGSSGGAAASVAEGMCFGSVGTDTGGSIRIPAAACGIVGLKPAFGEISCDGVVPLSTTLDHVGPLARSVADAAWLFQAMKGLDIHEIAPAGGALTFGSSAAVFLRQARAADARLSRARARPCARGGLHAARDHDRGCTDHPRRLPAHLPAGSVVLPRTDAWTNTPGCIRQASGCASRWDVTSSPRTTSAPCGFGHCSEPPWIARSNGATRLLLPALPIPAPPVGATTVNVGDVDMPVRAAMLSRTQLFNITGHPAIAMPAGRGTDGLPRSLQLVGPQGRTARLLEIAAALENVIR